MNENLKKERFKLTILNLTSFYIKKQLKKLKLQ